MTADAKVGLLLGLVFIVMIAFLIHGLPNFLKTASPDDMVTTAIAMPTAPELVIDPRIVETAQNLPADVPLRPSIPPQEVVVLDDSSVTAADNEPQIAAEPSVPAPQPVATVPAEPQPAQPAPKQPKEQPNARVHVVKPGENLAAIAQKYYGKEEGNRRATIQKLYEANRGVLDSPDKVRTGDKLSIPYLQERQNVTSKPAADPQKTLMDKFAGMFERTKEPVRASERVYVVQKGDNLWSIAQKTLGDGKRYKEIVQMNRGVKADDLVVGSSLKIPNK